MELPRLIYVVMGTTGEYSARIEWPVAAYAKEEQAQQHVLLASCRARELHQQPGLSAYDPGHKFDDCFDSAGTTYYLMQAPCSGEHIVAVAQTIQKAEAARKQAQRIATLEQQVQVLDSLLEGRNRVLDAFECPEHGRCVSFALKEIARLTATDTVGARSDLATMVHAIREEE